MSPRLTLYSYLGIYEELDYGSDTNVPGEHSTTFDSPVQEARPHTAPNPFAEHRKANAPLVPHQTPLVGDAIITNPLDAQQQLALHHEESAQRRMQLAATLEGRRGYLFTPLGLEERIRQKTGHSQEMWAIGAEPSSSDDVASRQVLCERYSEPFSTTQSQYKLRLDAQARGAPVPPIIGIPILSFADESPMTRTTRVFAGCIGNDNLPACSL